MNQCFKDRVYNRGTLKQAEFLAELGGMTKEEKDVFLLIHDGKTESYIQDVMGLSRKSYERIEDNIRAKLLIAIFECINYKMNN